MPGDLNRRHQERRVNTLHMYDLEAVAKLGGKERSSLVQIVITLHFFVETIAFLCKHRSFVMQAYFENNHPVTATQKKLRF